MLAKNDNSTLNQSDKLKTMDMLDENKELSAENLQKLKVADLKKELKSRGLPSTGTKQELITRLESVSQSSQDDPAVTTTTDNLVTTTEGEDNSEEILETAVEEDAEIELTDKTEKGAGEGDGQKVSENETEEHKVLSLKNVSEAERLQKRAEKFGCLSEDAKKKARAERFGISSQSGKTGQIAGGDGDIEKIKKRAERFGTVLSPALSKVDEEERIRKRKERFKSDEEEKILKRKERFGEVKANETNTKTSTFKYNKITMDGSTDAKKQKRAERFGLT